MPTTETTPKASSIWSGKSIFGGGDGLQPHEAALLTALLAAAFAADFTFGMFAMGWAAVILGAWILFDGRHSDPLLLVDTAHTFLSMYTYGGSSGLEHQRITLLHASYHITLVTLAAMLIGPKKWFGGLTPCLYTAASYVMVLEYEAVRRLDPSLSDVASQQMYDVADFLIMPWHWGVYNLLGGSAVGALYAFPFGAYTFYGSVRAMCKYPFAIYPATLELLASPRVTKADPIVRAILAAVPHFNTVILYPVVIPRALAACRHAATLYKRLVG